ncbi:prolyl oligopeptidase family serine peptidase [Ideonella sp. BN130291]|uniref:prolyl oligopeptidase family serine peptidase n=1 Tax=Ideonella sp. BN130291 TaxID=3112940 RepID=UPI002E269A5A|nr:prolyl oligopeptidase family serine peptidase [Ideonella sp. BN130291]
MAQTSAPSNDDSFQWLEEVQGEKALDWARERNAVSRKQLEAHPRFQATREELLKILNSKERIPYVSRQGDWFYNLWQDEKNKRGLWRRTTLAEYRKPNPAWETVLDLDALGAAEKENWVWHGATCFGPAYARCLLNLSRGGADAAVVREFDTQTKRFVDGGFALPEAKTSVDWLDADTVYVGTDFGPGSLTESGYPRVIKRWKRGQPLSAAVTVFEAQPKDVSAFVTVDRTPGFERTVFGRSLDFYNTEAFLQAKDGSLQRIDKPSDASVSFWREHLFLELRSDFKQGDTTFPRGSLLVADAGAYLKGERKLHALFTPTPTRSLAGFTLTRSHVLLNLMDKVASRVEEWHVADGRWRMREVDAPFPGTLGVSGLWDPLLKDDPLGDAYLLTYTDFLTPDTLALGRTGSNRREALKARPAFFDAAGMRVEQAFAKSKDGTEVPYFVVWPKGATADGSNPTLLYGYGGFEVSMQPWYSGGFGTAWFNHGGVLVVANIRGGGEFGPAWHQAALKANKQKSYDDFIAVAEDLIRRKITSPRHLGIEGGSNGGLLVGATFVQRPDLFNAVVCQVPLLDMKRYHKLLAGASWMAEYGNPDDPAEWAFISKYSPYQNVKSGVKYPKVLFTTSTRDDRVHPGHARKMAARMLAQGHELLYYENIEGGHGGAADNFQRADLQALEFSYLWQQLAR